MKKENTKKKRSRITLLSFLIIFIVFIFMGLNPVMKTVYYDDESIKIDKSFRIALVTDLHSCYYGDGQKSLIDEINKQKPDVVMLSGDIFDDDLVFDNAEIFIKEISKDYICYYVTGNHEFWSEKVEDIIHILKSYGVHVLRGESDTININGNDINICGVDDPFIASYNDENITMESQLKQVGNVHENGNYTILLAHRPEYVDFYLNYKFDLILSGHAHGGQWRLPGFVNGLYAPGQGVFPKYAGGKYDFDTSSMIVSRGLARESTRIPRFYNRPELVIIDVK